MVTKKPLAGLVSFRDFPGASALLAVISAGLRAFLGRDSAEGLRGGNLCLCFRVTPHRGGLNCGSALNPRVARQAGVILAPLGVQFPGATLQTIYVVLIVIRAAGILRRMVCTFAERSSWHCYLFPCAVSGGNRRAPLLRLPQVLCHQEPISSAYSTERRIDNHPRFSMSSDARRTSGKPTRRSVLAPVQDRNRLVTRRVTLPIHSLLASFLYGWDYKPNVRLLSMIAGS
jgi:hypothetical protein